MFLESTTVAVVADRISVSLIAIRRDEVKRGDKTDNEQKVEHQTSPKQTRSYD